MKQILIKHHLAIVLTFLGLLAGFAYWRFIGCQTGSCPITSNWYSSVLMGGLFGFLIADIINDFHKKRHSKLEEPLK